MNKSGTRNFDGWKGYILVNLVVFGFLLLMAWKGWTLPLQSFPGILIAMAAGFLGAMFSMLIKNRQRVSEGSLEELRAISSFPNLIVRGSVGLGAGVILYFFFDSGLLVDSLWPNLKELGFDELKYDNSVKVPNKDLCLLVIWCFLAGFSENLVPGILQKTEQKATKT